jgi:hypothetical protein
MKETTIKVVKKGNFSGVVGSLFFIIGILLICISGRIDLTLAGVFLSGFGTVLLIHSVADFLKRKWLEKIIINDKGIILFYDIDTKISIPWSNVEKIEVTPKLRMWHAKMLGILLKDPSPLAKQAKDIFVYGDGAFLTNKVFLVALKLIISHPIRILSKEALERNFLTKGYHLTFENIFEKPLEEIEKIMKQYRERNDTKS